MRVLDLLPRYRPAVSATAEREAGLFIGGESRSRAPRPGSWSSRPPANRSPRVQLAGEQDIDRAVEAARTALNGDWGKTGGDRALAAPARARRRDRRQPRGARRARVAERRQGELVREGGALRRGRELPVLRLGDRDDRRPLEPDRRLAALLLAEGAGRRRRADRPLELPAADGDVEARAGARGGLLRRPQARSADAADGSPSRRAGSRGRLPGRRDQRRPGRRADGRRVPRPASRRGQGRLHRLDEDGRPRSCGSPPTR